MNRIETQQQVTDGGARMSAAAVIEDMIDRRFREIEGLRQLLKVARFMEPGAEAELWRLLVERR